MATSKILLTTPIDQSSVLREIITHVSLVDFKYDWDREDISKNEYIDIWLAGTYLDGAVWKEPNYPGLNFHFEKDTPSESDLNELKALIEAGGAFSTMGPIIVTFLVNKGYILGTVV